MKVVFMSVKTHNRLQLACQIRELLAVCILQFLGVRFTSQLHMPTEDLH